MSEINALLDSDTSQIASHRKSNSLIDYSIPIVLIACIIYPGIITTVMIVSIFMLVQLLYSPEKRFTLSFFIIVTIAPFSILGETPGNASLLGTISIGNILLCVAVFSWILRLPLKKNGIFPLDKKISSMAFILWIVFLLALLGGIIINSNWDFIIKEANQWSYFIVLFPLFYSEIKKINKTRLNPIFDSIVRYSFKANLIIFSCAIYGLISGKTLYLGWLDPIAAGRILSPTWRTWRISYGAGIFVGLFGIYAISKILAYKTSFPARTATAGSTDDMESQQGITYWYMVLALSCFILGFGQNRMSILSFLLSMIIAVFYLAGNRTVKVSRIIALTCFLLIAAFLLSSVVGSMETASGSRFDIASLFSAENIDESYRFEEAKGVFKAALNNNFIGSGAGSSFFFFNPARRFIEYEYWMPHNLSLYLLFKLGIIGLVIYYLLWITILRKLWKKRNQYERKIFEFKEHGLSIISSCAIFASIISLILESQTGPSLGSIHGFIYTSLIICLVSADIINEKHDVLKNEVNNKYL